MMRDLSLHILDVVQNSVRAGADRVRISLSREPELHRLILTVEDNGCGMTEEQALRAADPFFTTRTSRCVGLGIPFWKLSAELTGGSLQIRSREGEGTVLTAEYRTDCVNMLPMGDMAATMAALISVHPELEFVYAFSCGGRSFELDTRTVRTLLGDVPIRSPEVLDFLRAFLTENQAEIDDPEPFLALHMRKE